MSNVLKQLSFNKKEDIIKRILELPKDKQAKIILYLLKQPT